MLWGVSVFVCRWAWLGAVHWPEGHGSCVPGHDGSRKRRGHWQFRHLCHGLAPTGEGLQRLGSWGTYIYAWRRKKKYLFKCEAAYYAVTGRQRKWKRHLLIAASSTKSASAGNFECHIATFYNNFEYVSWKYSTGIKYASQKSKSLQPFCIL